MCQMLKGSLLGLDKTALVMKNRSMVKMQTLLSLGSFLIIQGKLSLRFKIIYWRVLEVCLHKCYPLIFSELDKRGQRETA